MRQLLPALTRLDRAVFDALPDERASREATVLATVRRHWRDVTASDVRLILRGLEHLGLTERRNGWWRRVA